MSLLQKQKVEISSTLCPSLKGQLSRLEQIFSNPKVKGNQ